MANNCPTGTLGFASALLLLLLATGCASRPAREGELRASVRPPPNLKFETRTVHCAQRDELELGGFWVGRREVSWVKDQNGDGVDDLFAVTQMDDDCWYEGVGVAWCTLHSGLDGACLTEPTQLPWPANWNYLRLQELLEPLKGPAESPSVFLAVFWEIYGVDGLLWRKPDDITLHARVSPGGTLAALDDPDLARLRTTSDVLDLDGDALLHSIFGRDGKLVLRSARVEGEYLALNDVSLEMPWPFIEGASWLRPPLWRPELAPVLFAEGPGALAIRSFSGTESGWKCAPFPLASVEFPTQRVLLGRGALPPLVAFSTYRYGNHYDSRLFVWEPGPTPPRLVPMEVRRGEEISTIIGLPDITGDGADELGVFVERERNVALRVVDVEACDTLASIELGEEAPVRGTASFAIRTGERACSLQLVGRWDHGGLPPTWWCIQLTW